MRLHDDDAFKKLNEAWGNDVKGFTVLSKETVTRLEQLGDGSLQLPSEITVTVKFISLADIKNNNDALAKLIKAADSGRLGATKEDGTLLFREDVASQLNGQQTVLIRNKATGEEETRVATVESISEENYALVQAALAILIPTSSASTSKEEKVKATSPRDKVHQAPQEVVQRASTKSNTVKQMEVELDKISKMQTKAAQDARDKEKAAQKEQQREARKKDELKHDNLKWDIKQEEIKESVQKHEQTKKPAKN